MKRNQVVGTLQTNYQTIKKGKGKRLDKRVAYTLANTFAVKNRCFSENDYQQFEDVLKREVGLFNALSQPIRGILLGLLLANDKNGESAIYTLTADYQRLREAGFKLSCYSYFSAYLLQASEIADKEFIVTKGKELFSELKRQHRFLTGVQESAIAILLAREEKLEGLSSLQIANLVESYYQAFDHCHFRKSKQRLFAAAIAVLLTDGSFSSELVEKLPYIINELKDLGISLKPDYYPQIVTVAFLDSLKPIDFQALKEYVIFIEEQTNLRFYKNFRHTLALELVISETMESSSNSYLDLSALTISLLLEQEAAATSAAISAST